MAVAIGHPAGATRRGVAFGTAVAHDERNRFAAERASEREREEREERGGGDRLGERAGEQ